VNRLRLARLRVRYFRSIDDLLLRDLTQFNVFVGRNNVGKTTIFEAIARAQQHLAEQNNNANVLDDRCACRG
jgi:AAA15 family ATPase/GTPase